MTGHEPSGLAPLVGIAVLILAGGLFFYGCKTKVPDNYTVCAQKRHEFCKWYYSRESLTHYELMSKIRDLDEGNRCSYSIGACK